MWNDYGVSHRVVPSCETTIEFQFEGEGTTTLFLQKKSEQEERSAYRLPIYTKNLWECKRKGPTCVSFPMDACPYHHRVHVTVHALDVEELFTRRDLGVGSIKSRTFHLLRACRSLPAGPILAPPVLADVALLVAKHVVPSRPPASTFHRRGSEAARSNPRPFPSILFMKLPVCTRRWMLDPVRCLEDPTPTRIVLGSVTAQGRIVLRDL